MDVLVLHPSRTRYLLLTLASLLFAGAGVLIFFKASGGRVAGVLIALLFGATGMVGVLQLAYGTLRLSPEGFTVAGLGKEVTRRWSDVESFTVIRASSLNEIVGIRFAPGRQPSRVRDAVRSIAGYEGALPDTYGMSARDLAELMNSWRARYAR